VFSYSFVKKKKNVFLFYAILHWLRQLKIRIWISPAKLSAALHQPLDPLVIVQIRLKCYQISIARWKRKNTTFNGVWCKVIIFAHATILIWLCIVHLYVRINFFLSNQVLIYFIIWC